MEPSYRFLKNNATFSGENGHSPDNKIAENLACRNKQPEANTASCGLWRRFEADVEGRGVPDNVEERWSGLQHQTVRCGPSLTTIVLPSADPELVCGYEKGRETQPGPMGGPA